MKNFTRYLILFFFVIFTKNTRAEFFEDLSKIIENNEKKTELWYFGNRF